MKQKKKTKTIKKVSEQSSEGRPILQESKTSPNKISVDENGVVTVLPPTEED